MNNNETQGINTNPVPGANNVNTMPNEIPTDNINNQNMMNNVGTTTNSIPSPQSNETNNIANNANVQNTANNVAPQTAQANIPQNTDNPYVTPMNNQTNNQMNYQPNMSNGMSDEELLKVFIGNNYDKISTAQFNVSAFFFSTFYLFYRKMFLYGLLLTIASSVITMFLGIYYSLLINVLTGIFANKLYLNFAKNKIANIKIKNSSASPIELQNLCAKKGGTSVGLIFLGLLCQIGFIILFAIILMIAGVGVALGGLFNPDNRNFAPADTNIPGDALVIEDAQLSGHMCFMDCTYSLYYNDEYVDFTSNYDSDNLFNSLDDYSDYIKLDVYYKESDDSKVIVGYKMYLRNDNSEITNIKTENELRDKLGLYNVGTHTGTFTVTDISNLSYGMSDDESFTVITYTLKDEKNNTYEMDYKNPQSQDQFVKGNKYTISFEVTEDVFGYEFTIKSIE